MVADHDGLDPFDALGIQIMLIRIEDARTRTDPDTIANVETRLRTQVTAVEKALAADPDLGPREREDDDRRNVGPEPGIRADLDVGTLCDRNMNAMRSPFGIDPGTDRQARAGRERQMRRRKIRTGIAIE